MSCLRRLAALAIVAGLAVPAPALADNTADEADLHFRRGVEAYRAKRYEDALAEFFQSNRLVRNLNVLNNVARCYEQLKRYDEAYRYYSEVLASNPKAEDRKALEESLARIAPRVALLRVATDPPGAEIFAERKDLGSLGVSPKTLALPPGKTTVILALAGHRDGSRSVELAVGRTATVEVGLDFIWGRVRLAGEPAGAEVRVDRAEGPAEAAVPGVLKVRPGKHILHVSAPGHVPAQLPIEVAGDAEIEAAVALQVMPPATGNLVVTSNHEGALVRVDGKESGFTPTVLALPVGPHRVEVAMAEMRPFAQQVDIGEGATARVRAELTYAGAKTTAASKVETAVEDAPASITVISRDEIRAFGYQTLAEALRGVRGLFISNDRSYETVGVRGFAPPGDLNSRILVLYDGHAMWDVTGGQSSLGRDLETDLSEIERIEVVRGPVSSLYGTTAFFGVINLVPRRHLGERVVEASGAAGNLGLLGGRATGAWHGEAAQVLVSGSAARVEGDELFSLPGSDTVVRDRDTETAFHGTLRARWKELSLLLDVSARKKLIPTGAYGTLLGSDTRSFDHRYAAEARWDHPMAGGSLLAARAYFDATRVDGHWFYEDAAYPAGSVEQVDHTRADWGGVELRYRSPEVLRQHLTVGVEVQQQFRLGLESSTGEVQGIDDSGSFTVLSGYLVDELRVAEWMQINGSVRADQYFGSFGFTLNPRLAVIAHPWKGGVTKLMGGKSFRAPTFYDRFFHDGAVDPATGEMTYLSLKPSDGTLRPENILTAELEHAQQLGDELRAVGSIYVNYITDLIALEPDAAQPFECSGGPCLRAVNAAGAARTQGAELELRWQPARLAMVSASYGYQWMTLDGIAGDQAARLRANAPAHAFALKGMAPLAAPYLVGSAEAVYNSARRLGDGSGQSGELLFLNLGLSGELPGGRFGYFAGVRNLLDQRAQLPARDNVDIATVPSYGRTFVLRLSAAY